MGLLAGEPALKGPVHLDEGPVQHAGQGGLSDQKLAKFIFYFILFAECKIKAAKRTANFLWFLAKFNLIN